MMNKYGHIFWSSHLDDAILSSGGLIAKLTEAGEKVLVVTVFSEVADRTMMRDSERYLKDCGFLNPKALNQKRKREEALALRELGADGKCMGFVEAEYRGVYKNYSEISRGWVRETGLESELKKAMESLVFRCGINVSLYFPLGLGGHIDHMILRRVGEGWRGRRVLFWEDYPYLRFLSAQKQLVKEITGGAGLGVVDIGPWLMKKRLAVERYQSQIKVLSRYKELYLSNRENYLSFWGGKKRDAWVVMVTDELVGGAKKVNDGFVGILTEKFGDGFLMYEQVSPKMSGKLLGWRRWVWAVANYGRYLKIISRLPNLMLISTSPNLLMAAWVMKLLRWGRWKRLVYYCHADRNIRPGRWRKGLSSWLYWWLYSWSERRTVGVADKVLFPSRFLKRRMEEKGWRIREAAIVSPGIEFDDFVGKKKQKEKVVMYIGRVDRIKKIDLIIRSMRRLVGARLLVVSPKTGNDTEYLRELKGLSRGLAMKWVFLEDGGRVEDYYCQADCVVSVSAVESFSLVLLESFANGTIFCGVDSGIIGEFLSRVDKRLIIADQSLRSISKAIGYVLGLGEERRQRIIERAREELWRYNWPEVEKRFIKEVLHD